MDAQAHTHTHTHIYIYRGDILITYGMAMVKKGRKIMREPNVSWIVESLSQVGFHIAGILINYVMTLL